MTEEWKPVVGYEGYYEVSNIGNVRTVERMISDTRCCRYVRPSVVMRPFVDRKGRLRFILTKDKCRKISSAHRLVAMAFIPNPDNLPEVNHKDENPKNNRVENLEWCTSEYNRLYGTHIERISQKNWVQVIGTDKDGNEYRFASMKEAAEKTGARQENISHCCRGVHHTAGGYRWRYAEKTS